MSDGAANIEFYGKMEALVKDMDRLAKKQQETIEKFDKIGKTARKGGTDAEKATAAAAREMDKFAAATTKINQTPLEKYNRQLGDLKRALDAGKISQETFNRATSAATKELHGAADAGRQAFGGQAIASLRSYATGMFSLAAAAQFVGNAMTAAHQKTVQAMQGVEQLADSRMALRQVTQGATAGEAALDNQALNEQADRLAVDYGITREAARQLRFSARSEGYQGNEAPIAEAAGAGLVSVPEAARVAGQVPGLFGRTISPMGAVNATLVAAAESRLKFEEIARALPMAAEGAALAGSDAGETFTLLSLFAGKAASGETGAARIKAFGAAAAAVPEFKGRGIMGTYSALQAMPVEQRREFLGRSAELNAAYDWITELAPAIEQRRQKVNRALAEEGGPGSTIATLTSAALDTSTPEGRLNYSRRESIREANALAIQREQQLGAGGYDRSTATTRATRRMEIGPGRLGPLSQHLAGWEMQYAETAEASPAAIEAIPMITRFTGLGLIERQLTGLVDAVSKLFGAADAQQRAADAQEAAAENLRAATDQSAVGRQRAAAAVQPE